MKVRELIEHLQELADDPDIGDVEVEIPVLGGTDSVTHVDAYGDRHRTTILIDAS